MYNNIIDPITPFVGSTHCSIFELGGIDKFMDGIKTLKMEEFLVIGH